MIMKPGILTRAVCQHGRLFGRSNRVGSHGSHRTDKSLDPPLDPISAALGSDNKVMKLHSDVCLF